MAADGSDGRAVSNGQINDFEAYKNFFIESKLNRDSVVANFATTATDGKTYQVDYYNLDVIISVVYRVKSK